MTKTVARHTLKYLKKYGIISSKKTSQVYLTTFLFSRCATTRGESPSRLTTIKTEMVRSNSNPWKKKFVTTFQKKPKDNSGSPQEAKSQNSTSRTALLAIKIDADSGAKEQESISITGLSR